MNIIILGAAGFIGTNLAIQLSKKQNNKLTLVDREKYFFQNIEKMHLDNAEIRLSDLNIKTDFDSLLENQDIVYHLVSTTVPTTSNEHISMELEENIIFSSNLFEACVRKGIKKIIFISSGGTIYGNVKDCPICETHTTNPITSYGIQKLTIEKLLYLYSYIHGIDYRIIRLANPYGPYQRPNGILGAVTNFTYKALKKETIVVYGNGETVRDYIYIDDAIRGILQIADSEETQYKIYNLGSGYGTSINKLLKIIEIVTEKELDILYKSSRSVDVHINYLDICRYEKDFGKLNPISLEEGIRKTAEFMVNHYDKE